MKLNNVWSTFLNSIAWTQIATFRPHYRLKEAGLYKISQRLITNPKVEVIFYAMEKDRSDDHYHVHYLLKTEDKLSRTELAQEINTNPKSIGYIENVRCNMAVSRYTTKHMNHIEVYDLITRQDSKL